MHGLDDNTMIPPPDRGDELAALVAMDRCRPRGFAPWRLARHVEELGSAVAALSSGVVVVDAAELESARADVRGWLNDGLDVRSILDEAYPANLRGAFDAPPYVFVKGCFDDSWARQAIAVVGTRDVTPDGERRARKVTQALVEAGYVILSGLARGVDRQAHEAALDTGGQTVAVMGTGIHKVYPPEHANLANRIVESGGALISQFEPDAPGTRYTFPMRNATMSALALATVVIEAGETSGAKVQALAGLKHGSSVFLLRSLYESQPWARDLVDIGKYGGHAIVIDSEHQLLASLTTSIVEREPLSLA